MVAPEPRHGVIQADEAVDEDDKALDARRHDAHQALEDVAHKVLNARPDILESVGHIRVFAGKAQQGTHQHPDEGDDEEDGVCVHGGVQGDLARGCAGCGGHELRHQTHGHLAQVPEHAGKGAAQLVQGPHGYGLNLGLLLLGAGLPEVAGRPQTQALEVAILEGRCQRLDGPQRIRLDVSLDLRPSLVQLGAELLRDGSSYGSKIRPVGGEGLGNVLDGLLCRRYTGVDAVDKALRDVLADLGEHLRGRVDAQHVLDGAHHDCGHQRVPHPGDAVQQAGDDVLADVAPLIHTAVPHAGELGDAGNGGFAQVLDAAENAVYQSGQQGRATVQQIWQMGDQCGRELGNQLRRCCDQLGQVVGDADDELFQQLDAGIEDLVLMVSQILHQLGDDLRCCRCQSGDHLNNTCGQVFQNSAGCVQHGRRAALIQSARQGIQAIGAPVGGFHQARLHGLEQVNTQVLCRCLEAFHAVLEGVSHGLVGGVGRSGTVHHLGQHAVEFVRAARCQRKSAGSGLHAGP